MILIQIIDYDNDNEEFNNDEKFENDKKSKYNEKMT